MSEATQMPTWDAVLSGQVELDEVRPLLAVSAQEIDEYLAADSETEEETLDVLRRRLEGPIQTTTYDAILGALRALMGDDGTGLIHWYVTSSPEDAAILRGNASPRVEWFLRRIVAAHGPELQAAFALWRDLPDDWKSVNREVFYDVVRERYYIRHKIFKVDGSEVTLEGNADSVLDLARTMLLTLRWIGTADAYSPAVKEAFLAEADEFIAMVRSAEAGSNGGEPAAG
jgi:hypothetical protein